jgi:hypothetical protein
MGGSGGGRRPAVAPGGRRRRRQAGSSPEQQFSSSQPPNRAEKAPGGRGEDGDAYQGHGGEGITAEEEIGWRLRRRRSGSGGDRDVHAEGASEGAVRVEEVSRAPYMGQRGKGRRRPRRWRGALRRRPLMAAVRGGGACRGGERVWEHGRVQRAAAGALGCAFIGQGGEEGRRPK